jgi:hypothetical protein
MATITMCFFLFTWLTLCSFTKGETFELPLLDDDAQAMVVICNILHLRWDYVPAAEKISMTDLQSVACVADKYDCANALKPISRAWMSRCTAPEFMGTMKDSLFVTGNALIEISGPSLALKGYERLLLVSYAFNNAEAFKSVSVKILLEWKGDFTALRDTIDPSHRLPRRIFSKPCFFPR